jgi:cytidylate kinase
VRKILIAIDGPAGSGKSTTAKLVARRLGYVYIDTGAMYRAMTLKVLTSKVDPANEQGVTELAKKTEISFVEGSDLRVMLDGADVTDAIRSEDVNGNVSLISSYPDVREIMVAKQRAIGAGKGCVMDGRDIGTVVFPDAELKFYMIADIMERAKRRQEELSDNGVELPIHQVVKELKERDRKDSTRDNSPLKKADDAIELDTTKLTIEEQVEIVLNHARDINVGSEGSVGKEEMQRK